MIIKNKKRKIEDAINYILNDNLEELIKLFEKGFDPNTVNKDYDPLWKLAIHNDKKEAYTIINDYRSIYGLPKNVKNLCKSIKNGDINSVKNILSKGIDPNSCDSRGATLLNLSVISNNTEIVKLLLESKATKISSNWGHPLITASENNIEIMKLLLEYNIYNNEFAEKAFILSAKNNNLPVAIEILDNDLDITNCGKKALKSAAKNGSREFLNFLFSKGYKINELYDDENILMSIASTRYNNAEKIKRIIDFVKELITMGADPTIENSKGQTPLDLAKRYKRTDMIELFKTYITADKDILTKKLNKFNLPKEVLLYISSKETDKIFSWPTVRNINNVELNRLEDIVFSSVPIYSWEYRENEHSENSSNDPNIDKDGGYYFSAIELVKSVNDYDNSGLLIWIPELKQFGTADTGHGVVYIFKDVKWEKIVDNLHYYIDYQWNGDLNDKNVVDIYDYCEPWKLWEFK